MLPEYVNYHFVDDFSEFVVIENYFVSLTGSGYILSVVKFSNSYKQGDFYYNFILENKYLSLKSRSGQICLLSSNYQIWEFDFASWIQFNIFSNWLIYGGILGGIAVIIIYKLLKNRKYNKQLF